MSKNLNRKREKKRLELWVKEKKEKRKTNEKKNEVK